MDSTHKNNILENERELWKRAREHNDETARNKLITAYLPLAKNIAAKLYAGRIGDDVEFNDYLQYAELGLIEAANRYDPDSSAQFSTYATYRIKGAILSGIEKFTEKREQIAFRKRYLKDRLNSLSNKKNKLKNRDTFAELVELTVGMALTFMLEGTGQVDEKPKINIDVVYEHNAIDEVRQALLGYLDFLSEREQLVIRQHYFKNMGFEELASMLGVTKGRVSQIHKSAIQGLKRHFERNNQLDSYY